MNVDIFKVGQYVEFTGGPHKGEEALVWRIGDEYLELLRQEDFAPAKTPYFVAIQDASSEIRLLQPKLEPNEPRSLTCLPPNAESVYETRNNRTKDEFEEHGIVVWNGPFGPVLDVIRSRSLGVLPVATDLEPEAGMDGSWSYFRKLTTQEWDSVQQAFEVLDFWALPYDDAVRTDDQGEYWELLAYCHGRQHEVLRTYTPNDIEPFCRLLFSIAEEPGLTRGDSSMLS
ncbi:MAG: hypothetical protein K8T91_04135 [Planctomycetes bacterium]|nr:hypothetical protein [Planctomycetota bacterium]